MTFAVLWAVEVEKIGWYVLRNRRKRGGEVCGGGGCRWPYSIQYEVQSMNLTSSDVLYTLELAPEIEEIKRNSIAHRSRSLFSTLHVFPAHTSHSPWTR